MFRGGFGTPLVWRVGALFLVALGLREAAAPRPFIDVDAVGYARMASSFHAWMCGGPWDIHAGDYWPLLYGFLSGLVMFLAPDPVQAGTQVSVVAGALSPVVLFLGARWLWPGCGERAAGLAAVMLACYPQAVWYASSPRTDTLYSLLYLCGAVATCRALAGGSALAAGAWWGVAYLARFEALAGAALAAARLRSGGSWLRGRWAFLAGLLPLALPYVIHVSLLAGRPTVVPPSKVEYDGAEAGWTLRYGTEAMARFTFRAGLHGSRAVDLPPGPSLSEACLGVAAGLPGQVDTLCWNLAPLVLALCAYGLLRDAGARAVGAWMLPALLLPVAVFWDPHPRYYGFCIPFALLISAGVLARLSAERQAWAALGVLAGAGWHVTPVLHPDDHAWLGPDVVPQWWTAAASGLVAGVLLWRVPRLGALLLVLAVVWAQGFVAQWDENDRHGRMVMHTEADAVLRRATTVVSTRPLDAFRVGTPWRQLPPVAEEPRFDALLSPGDVLLVDTVDLQEPAYLDLGAHISRLLAAGRLRLVLRERHGWDGLETRVYEVAR